MTRQQIISELQDYFKIHELVGSWTYRIHKDRAWKFFSTEALHALLITRKGIGKPMTINNWKWGGRFSQRGLRTNMQNIFRQMFKSKRLYLSGHVLGEAFDFDVQGMSAESVRGWIIDHAYLYPMKIRLENLKNGKPINWVHLDTIQEDHNPEVYLFNV